MKKCQKCQKSSNMHWRKDIRNISEVQTLPVNICRSVPRRKMKNLKFQKEYTNPKSKAKTCSAESKDMFSCQTLIFKGSKDCSQIVIYLHGGAYVNEIMIPHISFCDRLAKKVSGTVFAPLYPLAPNHTYDETYDILEKLYRHLLELDKPITIMGDSSGGGLSAAFAQYLAANDLPQPENLILISPWVDVSMSGKYDDVEKDPMSGVEGLREMGRAWAGNLDLKDYKVSPLFGDVSNFPKTTIFVGTHEQIYHDVTNFYNKLKDNDINVELNVGEGMNHVYPVYPLVPESKEAFNHIVERIMK